MLLTDKIVIMPRVIDKLRGSNKGLIWVRKALLLGGVRNYMSDEQVYQFVDTNILIYAYDVTAGDKHQQARALLAKLWQTQLGCISVQVMQEFYVVGMRKLTQFSLLLPLTTIVSDLATWRVHAPNAEDVLGAIQLHQRYQTSFWDAMILHSAIKLDCAIVWSEDLNTGQSFQQVRVLNPFLSS